MSAWFGFDGTWTAAAPMGRVQQVLVDLEHYPDWWPQVLAVAKLTDDDARVLCRSTLPYTLDLVLHAERRDPTVLETSLTGDLEGTVAWHLSEHDAVTRLRLEQRVRVTGRLLAAVAPVARPVLRWNHDRMMAGCIAGLGARLGVPTGAG